MDRVAPRATLPASCQYLTKHRSCVALRIEPVTPSHRWSVLSQNVGLAKETGLLCSPMNQMHNWWIEEGGGEEERQGESFHTNLLRNGGALGFLPTSEPDCHSLDLPSAKLDVDVRLGITRLAKVGAEVGALNIQRLGEESQRNLVSSVSKSGMEIGKARLLQAEGTTSAKPWRHDSV